MSDVGSHIESESFRDSIATINKEGKRAWIYAQKPKGPLYNARTIVSVVFLALFFTLPFIKINDTPLFLFNVLERKFIFFGVTFWPQDFFIFGLGMLVFIVFIVLFTVIYGRVFCGWVCPQTIFMEMVFRKIEYWIEGSANQQKANKNAKNFYNVWVRKIIKNILFFIVSFIIANTFLSYIIGVDKLILMASEPAANHAGGLIAILLFTGVFYFVYAWFREQVCLIVCPYGRLQGVLLDKNSIIVAYDYVRGEPRNKFTKKDDHVVGDCIDCDQCVKVCPTGIDIRNGTQLECVNCTACIDACDHMMEGVRRPKGLIRYASENGIKEGKKLQLTNRIKAYTTLLFVLIGVLVILLVTRKDIDATVLRTPGLLYQEQENGMVSNLYNIKVINKTNTDIPLEIKLADGEAGAIKMIGKDMLLKKQDKSESEFFILIPKEKITERKKQIRVELYSNNKRIQTIKTSFLGPVAIKTKNI